MYGRAFLMVAAAAAGACSHAATPAASVVDCSTGAAVQNVGGLTGEQACALVRERVTASLAADSSARDVSVDIDLDLSRNGSAIARVRHIREGASHTYPDIAVDVMDRAMNRADLGRLADAVTQSILTELHKG